MGKIADRYFQTDTWAVIEAGFRPQYSQVAESVFSLGNEFMGSRGFFEEGYSGLSMVGNYFNGIYERKTFEKSYKGVADTQEFMVNSVNWLYTELEVDEERLDLAICEHRDYIRVLDLKTGMLTRSFVWRLKSGKELYVQFERFLSMTDPHLGGQKILLKALNFNGSVSVSVGLDNSVPHYSAKENFWSCSDKTGDPHTLSMIGTTRNTRQKVWSFGRIEAQGRYTGSYTEDKKIWNTYEFQLKKDQEQTLCRVMTNCVCRKAPAEAEFEEECRKAEHKLISAKDAGALYMEERRKNAKWWKEIWKKADIEIRGDDLNQQGIRFCIFQMFQTYHGAQAGDNIGAKGLTGEAYNGNAFWDTETYCLPFFLFNHLEAAKNLIDFRYLTLEEAKKRATELDCAGAFYPVATISGKECCNLWQHASLQLQASTAVAYGIWMYDRISHDEAYVYGRGIEMLIGICRMLATRGSWSQKDGSYGYYCVMGPDEFQMMVNHNFYTNAMAKFVFQYTCRLLEKVRQSDTEQYETLCRKTGLLEEEPKEWKRMAKHMYILYDPETKLFQQHDGYFSLPHIDVDQIPTEDFPLYDNWSYDRIYRNDMIKQPDVLMMMLLFNSYFDQEQLLANYEYYEPRCIHESSLSPSVHSILAAQLGKDDASYEFFKFATRMDLDNYNRNTQEGLHTTSIAAAWMNIVYGFGGMRSDGAVLKFAPVLPKQWDGYRFCISYQGTVIHLDVAKEKLRIWTEDGKMVSIQIYETERRIGAEPVVLPLKSLKERKGRKKAVPNGREKQADEENRRFMED